VQIVQVLPTAPQAANELPGWQSPLASQQPAGHECLTSHSGHTPLSGNWLALAPSKQTHWPAKNPPMLHAVSCGQGAQNPLVPHFPEL